MNCWMWNISLGKKDYFEKEIEEGRLRQGWGWQEMNLQILRNKKEKEMDEHEKAAWDRCKYMMESIKEGDFIVVKNIPNNKHFTLVKVTGEYNFDMDKDQGDFGHYLPIKKIETFHKMAKMVPKPFVNYLNRERWPIRRVIKYYDTIVTLSKNDEGETMKPEEFKEMLEGSKNDLIKTLKIYLESKLTPKLAEKLVFNLISREVEDIDALIFNAGSSEKGADILCEISYGYVFKKRLAIQVKMKWGTDNQVKGVKQLETAFKNYEVDAGLLVSFADNIGKNLEKRIGKLKEQYKDVDILYGEDLYLRILEMVNDPELEIIQDI